MNLHVNTTTKRFQQMRRFSSARPSLSILASDWLLSGEISADCCTSQYSTGRHYMTWREPLRSWLYLGTLAGGALRGRRKHFEIVRPRRLSRFVDNQAHFKWCSEILLSILVKNLRTRRLLASNDGPSLHRGIPNDVSWMNWMLIFEYVHYGSTEPFPFRSLSKC